VTQVTHFGLHYAAGDVGFLLQRGTPQSIYPDLECPFQVQRRSNDRSCPHAINLTLADDTGRTIFADPLAAWFAQPKGVALLLDPERSTTPVLAQLARLYSPTRPTVDFAWSMQARHWMEEGAVTNLSPWILSDVRSTHLTHVRALAAGALPRPVLLLAAENIPLPPNSTRLTTDLNETDLSNLSLERLGAWAVGRRLRRATISPT
jgi:hypothetical protein